MTNTRPPSRLLAENPHASPLARIIMAAWPAMLARFHEEAAEGLSVKQVGRFLKSVGYDGKPLAGRQPAFGTIANTLAWLERRRFITLGEGDRKRYKAVAW